MHNPAAQKLWRQNDFRFSQIENKKAAGCFLRLVCGKSLSVVADGFDRAAFLGFLAAGFFVRVLYALRNDLGAE